MEAGAALSQDPEEGYRVHRLRQRLVPAGRLLPSLPEAGCQLQHRVVSFHCFCITCCTPCCPPRRTRTPVAPLTRAGSAPFREVRPPQSPKYSLPRTDYDAVGTELRFTLLRQCGRELLTARLESRQELAGSTSWAHANDSSAGCSSIMLTIRVRFSARSNQISAKETRRRRRPCCWLRGSHARRWLYSNKGT